MLTKIVKLPIIVLIIGLLFSTVYAKADDGQQTMLWEMRPNESLIELAAMFYPKSVSMQRIFIAKTQQLNQDTQVYANANTRYPTATKIVIPTLKSLSVKGHGVKRKQDSNKTSKKAIDQTPTVDEQQLSEKKAALEAVLAEKNENLKALEEKVNQLKQQLDAPQTTVNNQSARGSQS